MLYHTVHFIAPSQAPLQLFDYCGRLKWPPLYRFYCNPYTLLVVSPNVCIITSRTALIATFYID